MNLEFVLDAIADFEAEWFETHSSSYTDTHYDEYRKEKLAYVERAENEYWKEKADMARYYQDCYENDPMVHYGWHQQDMIDLRRRER